MTRLAAAVLALALAGLGACQNVARDAPACPVAGTAPMTMVQLYFGRARVSDAEWDAFERATVAAQFPDGFTVYDATGGWRPAADRPTTRERSTVLQVAVPRGADIAARAAAVADAYKTRFHQRSVGVVIWDVCGGF